ncbi:MAG: sigma-70 family RNA polymerase sigma factor [Crocinitomicaceae bacterium]|nr:sigma-70 family RNA polymerase sigma factor [Flavobacteriales bacterium]NQZ35227.1 sigma-70 family RNA polymerase sigma factor [Crocinitomicaceae bacterium]
MQKRNEKDFKQLLEDNKYSIYRICRIYTVPPNEAQDLFQEVVFEIWKSLPNFKGKSNISTWVYKIALNVCSRSKSQLIKGKLNTVRLESVEFKSSEIIPNIDQDKKYNALYACISSLEESDQSIMVLYLENLPYKRIAEITGMTENHVAVKMKRIRKKLLHCITSKLN